MKRICSFLLLMSSLYGMEDQSTVIERFYETFSCSLNMNKEGEKLLNTMKKTLSDEELGDHACKISQYDGLSTPHSIFCFKNLIQEPDIIFNTEPQVTVFGLCNLIKMDEIETIDLLCEKVASFSQVVHSFCLFKGFDWLEEERIRWRKVMHETSERYSRLEIIYFDADLYDYRDTKEDILNVIESHCNDLRKKYLEAHIRDKRFQQVQNILLSIHTCALSGGTSSTISESSEDSLSLE